MKNKFYRPQEVDTEEFNDIVTAMHNDLVEISKGNVQECELTEYLTNLISEQQALPINPKMGFWGLDDPNKMPGDARVDFFYVPTYIATGILMICKLNFFNTAMGNPGFQDALEKGLHASAGRGLQGHGHDAIAGMIQALNIFILAKAHTFTEMYPNDCNAFTRLFSETIQTVKDAIASGNTKGDWGEEYKEQFENTLNALNKSILAEKTKSNTVNLFVYGTLMKNNCHGVTYLSNARFLGDCVLKGYALYDFGAYPGIVEDQSSSVKGELYEVSSDSIPAIDRYEGEGYLYKRKRIDVYSSNHSVYSALTYVYNQSTDGRIKIDYEHQPWYMGITERMKINDYVWYAAYGSNINKQRFMKYIQGCSNNTPPLKEKPFVFSHPIYFANRSSKWENAGVAFLDIEQQGKAYGKLYMITEEQFKEVHKQEGSGLKWYNEAVQIGIEDGVPIKTITHTPCHTENVLPSKRYLSVIKNGIQETYPTLTENEIDAYLAEATNGLDN
ncbi:MAG: gamma-glutamylcyclotransferase [Ruminiclostridium sp.]|nr:gamma-glutamylcyclotransferase [Ruminiclostridium sp.]